MTLIRAARPGDEAHWRRLWAAYCAFYRSAVPDAVTATTWGRILDPLAPVFCLVAEHGGGVAGFAVCVVHARTWSIEPIVYLEDLYVDETVRGGGVGFALIEGLKAEARRRGAGQLYWHTEGDNRAARRLYDRFRPADGYVRYRLDLPGIGDSDESGIPA
ncbi:GNAT family N-acetyltransferase [Zavarzinia compransoris]|uniref:GNAT family N-acetyltransferase n=1 Tax=Zavarzinia compransoris TaxID=1264899 RepID=A0A317E2L0_9PROT|nr:GNAT family N-acetyltransferase [Zavarzinia compransoris]PWR20841.1 GNAT family N-acetyltransferase [Zavarzinia compransoris]TDP44323.1 ribosomal protein S18 acetylase RimI-like enzyme [Zavarzinia compransoris]